MSISPEGSSSGEARNREVFDIFDRLSSHRRDTAFSYFIGDGLVVRIGWVSNRSENDPDLTLELIDEKCHRGIILSVGQEDSHYQRRNQPYTTAEWLEWSQEERRESRKLLRHEDFAIPTGTLAPIAGAVSHTEPGGPPGTVLWEAATEVDPLPTTDVQSIRDLIEEFSRPLD
jgi:hypothetical protein